MTESIPQGYKQTEIGVIPEDWDLRTLDSIGLFKKGRGIKKEEVIDQGFPCIRYGELYTKYKDYILKLNNFIHKKISEESEKIKKGDLLFAGSGETREEIGMCAAYLNEDPAFAGGDIIIFSPQEGNSQYLGFLMNHKLVVKQKSKVAQGDAVVHIYASSMKKILISYPDPKEQSAIATVLSQTDELTQKLDKLISKKKDIKKGAMQELLTGKKRLPGFSGEWENLEIKDLCSFEPGKRSKGGDNNYLEIGDINISNKTYSISSKKKLSVPGAVFVPKGILLISTVRPTRGAITISKENLCVSGAFCRLRIKNKFIFHYVCYDKFLNYLGENSMGGTYPTCRKQDILNYKFLAPKDSKEQSAIASVLSDMDSEIEELEQKRDKYQIIKEGMMQQLLTGKIRLKWTK